MINIKRLVFRINRFKMKEFNFVMFTLCIVCMCMLVLVKVHQDINNPLLEKHFWDQERTLKNCSNGVSFERLDSRSNLENPSKYHVIYLHYLNTDDAVIRENFNFFMHFAHEPCHADVDFTIILNVASKTYQEQQFENIYDLDLFKKAFSSKAQMDRFKSCESNSDNSLRNTRLVIRENTEGGDLCAYSDLMRNEGWLQATVNITHFFFIN